MILCKFREKKIQLFFWSFPFFQAWHQRPQIFQNKQLSTISILSVLTYSIFQHRRKFPIIKAMLKQQAVRILWFLCQFACRSALTFWQLQRKHDISLIAAIKISVLQMFYDFIHLQFASQLFAVTDRVSNG